MSTKKFIAPDGGWGWMVIIGGSLSSTISIPMLQGFGLVYGPLFKRLGISATKLSFIINLNHAFGLLLGLSTGPLLRSYGYRKIALVGAILMSAGMILTAYARSFFLFIVAYGMMNSLGRSLNFAANMLATNTYFMQKRGRAVGVGMTIVGFGTVVMLQLISYLLTIYSSHDTMLILGGVTLHSIIGALLLQPIKWHAKRVDVTQTDVKNKDEKVKKTSENTKSEPETVSLINGSTEKSTSNQTSNKKKLSLTKRKMSLVDTPSLSEYEDNISVCLEVQMSMINGSFPDVRDWSLEGKDLSSKLNESYHKKINYNRSRSVNEPRVCASTNSPVGYHEPSYDRSVSYNEAKARDHALALTKHHITATVPSRTLDDCPEEELDNDKAPPSYSKAIESSKSASLLSDTKPAVQSELKESKSTLCLVWQRIVELFDLGLLCDPIYVNIMLGMSIVIFVEMNFSAILPLMFSDMGLTPDRVAMILSVSACADLGVRALIPLITELLKISPRVTFLFGVVFAVPVRCALLYTNSYTSLLIVGVLIGAMKGFRAVNMALIIPKYVPLERLAAAGSIQLTVNGLILLVAGPTLGVIKDLTGSYSFCVTFLNIVSVITVVLWLGEYAVKHTNRRRKLLQEGDDIVERAKIIESR